LAGKTHTMLPPRSSRRGTCKIAGGLPANPSTATSSLRRGVQDRAYYRECCRGPAGEQVFGLYHDTVTLTWVLDVTCD